MKLTPLWRTALACRRELQFALTAVYKNAEARIAVAQSHLASSRASKEGGKEVAANCAIFLEHRLRHPVPLAALWITSGALVVFGHASFHQVAKELRG